jgi:hypothetical protein
MCSTTHVHSPALRSSRRQRDNIVRQGHNAHRSGARSQAHACQRHQAAQAQGDWIATRRAHAAPACARRAERSRPRVGHSRALCAPPPAPRAPPLSCPAPHAAAKALPFAQTSSAVTPVAGCPWVTMQHGMRITLRTSTRHLRAFNTRLCRRRSTSTSRASRTTSSATLAGSSCASPSSATRTATCRRMTCCGRVRPPLATTSPRASRWCR